MCVRVCASVCAVAGTRSACETCVCQKKYVSKRKLNAARNVCFNALKRQILREERAV